MPNEVCPFCKHKSAYYRGAFSSWRCSWCKKEYTIEDKEALELETKQIDKDGNRYEIEIDKWNNKISVRKTYFLPKGKITLKGNYKKLKECDLVERDDCNYGYGYERCKFMIYKEGNWVCIKGKNQHKK